VAGPEAIRILEEAAKDPGEFERIVRQTVADLQIPENELLEHVRYSRQQIQNGRFSEPDPPGLNLESMIVVGQMIAKEISRLNY
jgi:hypothetical protein